MMVVGWEAELLPGTGSVSAAETVAVLTMTPLAPVSTVVLMVTVALPPATSEARPQVNVPPEKTHAGGPGTEETNVRPAGNVSATTSDVPSEGPRLTMARV